MQTHAKQTYVTPEFIGTQVLLESGLCEASANQPGDPVSKDGNLSATINKQNGFDGDGENPNYGFIDNSWENN